MPVQGCHQHRGGAVTGTHLVDVGSAIQKRLGRANLPFPRRQQQGCQATVRADEVRVRQRLRHCAALAALPRDRRGWLVRVQKRPGERVLRLRGLPYRHLASLPK